MEDNVALAQVADFEDRSQHVLDVSVIHDYLESEVSLVDPVVVRTHTDCAFKPFEVLLHIVVMVVFRRVRVSQVDDLLDDVLLTLNQVEVDLLLRFEQHLTGLVNLCSVFLFIRKKCKLVFTCLWICGCSLRAHKNA